MPSFARTALVVTSLLLVAAGCGVTGGDDADSTTTTTEASTTSTTADESTTTEPESTTTTDGGSSLDENDPELEALLLTAEDFDADVEVDDDEDDSGFEEEICDGQGYTVVPERQASVGFTTADLGTFVSQGIAEFGFEDDASLFIEELQSLNQACLDAGDDDALPATFEPIPDLGDEAIRAVLLPDAAIEGLELIVVRADERVILLANLGEEQLLTNALIIEAVDRAAP
jgi:hypothetical protein